VRRLRAGARGYLLKDATDRVLFVTIRAAMRGDTLLPLAAAVTVVPDYLLRPKTGVTIAWIFSRYSLFRLSEVSLSERARPLSSGMILCSRS